MPTKILTCVLLAISIAGCSAYESGQQNNTRESGKSLSGTYVLSQQVPSPPEIQSIQLYTGDKEDAPPIIKLGSRQQLSLEFDDLSGGVRQFKLNVSHRTKNWEESPIGPTIYLGSFFETYFSDGRKSFVQNPDYYHYSYRFPNEQLSITKSGNYLLSIFDADSNELLFRIPFFVSEEKGTLDTRIETLFAQRNNGRTVAQPFSEYRYPDFVEQPQFDLSFAYVQNQFWGRMRQVEFYDTATPGLASFHLGRNQSFIADYEFNILDIRSFQPDGRQIVDYLPGQKPPLVVLRRDVQLFETNPARYQNPAAELYRNERQAQYGMVEFSFEPATTLRADTKFYLAGDFNDWMIDETYRMRFDSSAALWKTRALIKQGVYRYKYIVLNSNGIDDLRLDRMFTDSRQQYITFAYFRDPQRNFDRLLKVDISQTR